MADATAEEATEALTNRLETAAAELDAAERAVAEEGESALQAVAETYEAFLSFINENDGKATGSGRDAFRAYVAFQDELVARIERLPDDLPAREAFEAVGEVLDKRRLSPADMDRARSALEPAAEKASLLDDRRAAQSRYRRARSAVVDRLREVESAIEDRSRLLEYADADLEGDLAPLRNPVMAYNEAVHEAFRRFKRTASARELLDLLAIGADYPLVGLEPAPNRLAAYLREQPVGHEPVSRLVELAGYSASKLAHYVDNPDRFRATVAANRTYLDRLDADPLTVEWPPPPAAELRFRARELIAVVDRFAPERVVATLHELRDLTREPRYERLRQSAVAQARLRAEEREQLRSGRVQQTLESLQAERERLQAALEAHPKR